MTVRRARLWARPDLLAALLAGIALTFILHNTAFAAPRVQPPPPATPGAAGAPAGVWTVPVNGVDAPAADSALPLRLHARDAMLDGATVRITTPDAAMAGTLSPAGLVFQLDTDAVVAAAMASGDVTLTIDYGGLPRRYGGDFAGRLTLYRAAGCTVDAAGAAACATWTPLPGVNDRDAGTLTVTLDAGIPRAAVAPNPSMPTPPQAHHVFVPLLQHGPDEADTYYVLASSVSSEEGDYSATPLASRADYQVGLFTGDAETGYTIPVPAAAAGPQPALHFAYSSGIVDSLSRKANNQGSALGLGWSMDQGAITRTLMRCSDYTLEHFGGTYYGDDKLCEAGEHEYALHLNGTHARLIHAGGNLYRVEDDPGWRVERFTDAGATHPDDDGAYWIVTAADGVTYRMGGALEPETGAAQNSVFHAPLYTAYEISSHYYGYVRRQKAWQWNLDRVEDANGNVVSYFYDVEPNAVEIDNQIVTYVRAGRLARIEYTKRSSAPVDAHARVVFNYAQRCAGEANLCTPADMPDVPDDLACSGTSCPLALPTFWTRYRLHSVLTQTRTETAASWRTATVHEFDYALHDEEDSTADELGPRLWLSAVTQRPGGAFARSAYDPAETVTFDAAANAVRVGEIVKWQTTGAWVKFADVDFGQGAGQVVANVNLLSSFYRARFDLRLDSPTGPTIGTITTPPWGSTIVTQTVTGAAGVHDLYVVLASARRPDYARLYRMRFVPSGSRAGLPPVTYGYTMLPLRHYLDEQPDKYELYRPHLLTMTNELGGTVAFTYGQSHACPTDPFPDFVRAETDCYPIRQRYLADLALPRYNHWKVTQVETDDGTGAGAAVTTYTYAKPTWHYNTAPDLIQVCDAVNGQPAEGCRTRVWSDFRGHAVVTVTDAAGAQTEYRFYQGMDGDRLDASGGVYNASITLSDGTTRPDHNWLRGRVAEVRRLDAQGNVLERTVHEYTWQTTAGSGDQAARMVHLAATETTIYGTAPATPSVTTRSEYAYDGYGNVVSEVHRGDVSTPADDRTVTRGYAVNPSAHMVDRLAWEALWAGDAPGASGQELARAEVAYDGQAVGAPPVQGNPTLARVYSQVAPAPLYADTVTVYDAFGRPTAVTDPLGRTTTTAYHPVYGYAQSVTNAAGHTVQTELDPGLGAPLRITDANGKVTELAYDGYGRLTHVWLPSEATGGPASLEFAYFPAARPAFVHSRTLRDAATGSYLESWAYVDGFARAVQTQTPTLDGGRTVSSQAYNALGQVATSAAPYALSGAAGSGYVAPDWSTLVGVHAFTYDALGRPLTDTTLAQGAPLWSTSTSYDGLSVRHVDANGRPVDQRLDVWGNLVQVTDHNDPGSGPEAYTTGYAYDLAGNLVQVTDHHGNVTSMSYDLLGRKTAMVDPDMGAWLYQYDAAGNLTAQRDGRGQWLHLGYDSLNRLTAKRRDAVDGPLLAAYVYDMVALGQLYAAQAYAGAGNVQVETRTTALDDRYRATAQEWIVAGQGTFRMATAYNAADQVTSLTYPADNAGNLGEVVVQGYNSIGRLTNVTGHLPGGATEAYVASALYNARGQLTALASGNGLTRQYDYAPDTLRLTHIRAGMGAPWTDLQSLSYTYDASGNILTLTDGANAGQVQSFGYDWLNRLVSASTNAAGVGQYSHTYAYDAIGNITNFAGSAYVYSATQPHAVTTAHGNTYAYDANGNQTVRTIAGVPYAMIFDAENRLTTVAGGSTNASFVYAADGSRVVGTVDGVTTVYIGGVYEWQAGAATAYYAGPDGPVAFRRSGYATDNGVYYLLRDHLSSSSVIVDGSGNAVKREFYYPFGGNRGSAFSDLTSKRFTGQYHEDGLPGGEGLSYYNARWYDAQLGRFVSADTIVPDTKQPQDWNRYAYVRNNPLGYTDPTGHDPWWLQDSQAPLSVNQGVVAAYYAGSPSNYIYDEMQRNIDSTDANLIRQLNLDGDRVGAYSVWAVQVMPNGVWDHKPVINKVFPGGETINGVRYANDTWSNIHYGYVGVNVGFTRQELLWGAGIAQWGHEVVKSTQRTWTDPRRTRDHWRNEYWREFRARNMVRGDHPTDQNAIALGIGLWNRYGRPLRPSQFMLNTHWMPGLSRGKPQYLSEPRWNATQPGPNWKNNGKRGRGK